MNRFARAALAMSAIFSLPALGGGPDTAVVEFYNSQTRHYFVTATASEARLVDTGAAGPGWMRTGRSFQAWLDRSAAPPDAVPVCRFYSTAANSHFYTASANECASLQAQAAVERATAGVVRGWQYEGVAYHVLPATGGACPAGTEPITRAYNNGFATGEGSNHRFVDDPVLQGVMANDHWTVEGVAFCSPVLSTGTQAVLPDTTTSFGILVGTWNGNARLEVETSSGETHGVVALQLAIDADGNVTGSGGGCEVTGSVAEGDGFRSLFTGTATLTGCANAALNGADQALRLQRFGQSVLMAQIHQEAGGSETTISATLTNKPASPPPGNAQDFSSVAGDWAGTVGFEAEDGGGHEVEGNKPLTLSISTSGAISGTGYGCTFTGTLSLPSQGRTFAATVTAAGCTSALFNGTYDHARVILDGKGRLHVAMEREGADGSVEIAGTLMAVVDTPPPPATASIAGAWQGTLAFAVGSSTSNVATTLAIGTGGAVSGTAGTCTFGGSVTLASGAVETTTGSITLAGCTAPALDGTYTTIKLSLQDGKLLVDLQRMDGTTQLHVSGTLSPQV